MSSYRSAYENYYKNINNIEKEKKENHKFFTLGNKADNSNSFKYGINTKYNDTMTNALIKRIIRELTGAILLLLFFITLKYIPLTQFREMHTKCKQTLEYNFNYNDSIDAFNQIQIGNMKGKDLKIGNFTTEDLRVENLKAKTSNLIEYIKSNGELQN